MRRILPGLSLAAAAVLLTACGGSDDDTASSETSASSSSAAETTAEQTDSEFCSQAASAFEQVEPALSGTENDPTALAGALQTAADNVRGVEPPSEISSDWAALADGIEQLAQAFAEVDVNDPNAQATLEQRTSEVIGSLTSSATNVQTYLSEECDLDVDSSEPAAPTS